MSDIDKDLADLNAATREAHEAIKELKGLLKDLDAMKDVVEREAKRQVELVKDHFVTVIEMAVEREVETMTKVIDKAIEDGAAAAERRFDHMTKTLLGENDKINELTHMTVTEYVAAAVLIEQQLERSVSDGGVEKRWEPR